MLCTSCRTRTAVTDDGRCTFCSGTRPAPPGGPMAAGAVPPGESAGRLRSPVGLSKAVVVLLCAVIAADLFAVGAGLNMRFLLDGGLDDGFLAVPLDEADRADRLYYFAGGAQVLTLLATAVVFIIWFRRVRLNAEIFDASAHTMRPGWAVGGWFVPFANLWFPYRVAAGVWTASDRTRTDGGGRTATRAPLNLWWAAWVCWMLFGRYASGRYSSATLPQEIVDAATLVVASDVLGIVAAVLALLFVRGLTRMQGERAALGSVPMSAQAARGGTHLA
ncbi:DUF4328 domain-containing protein [Streptomyces sp. NBC_01433]|uniref:DUF4328 domain-containing protein n=1 Tax=Streptomyces sp. NBC_01433 TaxID=2903864 RepID=UPI00224FFD99|nr:DUF4328 domain-containing protein [Streptomyces sp. NBC_01433]MCX4674751.1 DUF4328 domain-containing protein [Streptomyces sp. NBC_01433]